MRVFNSSTESLSDCTWPEAVSIFPLSAVVLLIDLLLQRVDRLAHLVGVIGGLLHQVLQNPKTGVEGGLQALHHVEQLLHLGLQLDDFLWSRMRAHGSQDKNRGEELPPQQNDDEM